MFLTNTFYIIKFSVISFSVQGMVQKSPGQMSSNTKAKSTTTTPHEFDIDAVNHFLINIEYIRYSILLLRSHLSIVENIFQYYFIIFLGLAKIRTVPMTKIAKKPTITTSSSCSTNRWCQNLIFSQFNPVAENFNLKKCIFFSSARQHSPPQFYSIHPITSKCHKPFFHQQRIR